MKRKFDLPPPPDKDFMDNPVKLCHDITRLSRARVRSINVEGVMSQPGAHIVLSILAHSDGVTQKFLVDHTHLRPPTISVMLRKMEEEGISERRENPSDRRQTLIYLTEYGRELDRRGMESIKATDALALEGLSPSELSQLMSLLLRVRENLIPPAVQKEEK